MLKFEKIRWKNFLSTGDKFIEILLNKYPSTLITGANGAGKSTLLDALSFVLFGKPHRNINKPQLVNSINEKNCVVEVEFSIGKNEYKICRGLAPGFFEIYINDKLVPQASTVKEYQRYLESNILKLNHKSFHQVVVLGSSNFIPFMQLPAAQRRGIIEDLLDINIFTKMNQILKEEHSKLKEEYKDLEYQIKTTKNKKDIQEKYIKDLENLNKEIISEKTKEIERYTQDGVKLQERLNSLQEITDRSNEEYKSKKNSIDRRLSSINNRKINIDSSLKQANKSLSFFQTNNTCPTCTQEINEETKNKKIHEYEEEVCKHQAERKEIESLLKDIDEASSNLNKGYEIIRKNEKKISGLLSDIRSNFKMIQSLQKDINDLQKKEGDVEKARQDLNNIIQDLEVYKSSKISIQEDMNYNSVIFEMLKDTGIKTKIIRQYLPVMNKLINQYLQILDFFVSFNLDENFNESIRSRHRDDFSYASFSEGEKQRIDLALLFTWRQIAKMKNSVSTNLLILDETFDSSLDEEGVENLLKILDTLDEHTNVFVISHKGHLLAEKFKSGLTFEKVNNFSVIRAN